MVRNMKGFTMVELMIVIAIIGVLAVTLVPAFSGMQNRAKDTGTSSSVNSAATALQAWATDVNGVPFPYGSGAELVKYATSTQFTSLTPERVCGPNSSSLSGVTVSSGAICSGNNANSFGYMPANDGNTNSGTYIIWAGLYNKTKGTLKSIPSS